MAIKAEVSAIPQMFTADVEFSDTAMSFFAPAWEISFFFGLFQINGKIKEVLRIDYEDIEEVKVGKTSTVINKKDACLLKVKTKKDKKSKPYEIAFNPFEEGRAKLYEYVSDRFI